MICTVYKINTFSIDSVKEFMDFTGKIIVERTQPGLRASVKEQGMLYFPFIIAVNIGLRHER